LPPLAEIGGQAQAPTLEELRLRGGPSHLQLRSAIEAALERADEVTLASVFNALPDDLRRPVEVLGLFPLTHTRLGGDRRVGGLGRRASGWVAAAAARSAVRERGGRGFGAAAPAGDVPVEEKR
jgi:hypothetical protein